MEDKYQTNIEYPQEQVILSTFKELDEEQDCLLISSYNTFDHD